MRSGKEELLWQLSYLQGGPRGAEKRARRSLPGPTLPNKLPCLVKHAAERPAPQLYLNQSFSSVAVGQSVIPERPGLTSQRIRAVVLGRVSEPQLVTAPGAEGSCTPVLGQ